MPLETVIAPEGMQVSVEGDIETNEVESRRIVFFAAGQAFVIPLNDETAQKLATQLQMTPAEMHEEAMRQAAAQKLVIPQMTPPPDVLPNGGA